MVHPQMVWHPTSIWNIVYIHNWALTCVALHLQCCWGWCRHPHKLSQTQTHTHPYTHFEFVVFIMISTSFRDDQRKSIGKSETWNVTYWWCPDVIHSSYVCLVCCRVMVNYAQLQFFLIIVFTLTDRSPLLFGGEEFSFLFVSKMHLHSHMHILLKVYKYV